MSKWASESYLEGRCEVYLTAQRVISCRDQSTGVNVFLHRHDECGWSDKLPADVPDRDPGELVKRSIPVVPGNNRVVSYLDIIGREGASSEELKTRFQKFLSQATGGDVPLTAEVGDWRFRFNLELSLAPAWRGEIEDLFGAALQLYEVWLGECGAANPGPQ